LLETKTGSHCLCCPSPQELPVYGYQSLFLLQKAAHTSDTDDYDGKEWEKKEEFKEIIKSFEKRHNWSGIKRHCHHCYSNSRSTEIAKNNGNPAILECECSKNKGVCENLVLDRGILGNNFKEKKLSSLSSKEWFMMNHVIESLLGFNMN
jgi:hypothetical protein